MVKDIRAFLAGTAPSDCALKGRRDYFFTTGTCEFERRELHHLCALYSLQVTSLAR